MRWEAYGWTFMLTQGGSFIAVFANDPTVPYDMIPRPARRLTTLHTFRATCVKWLIDQGKS